MSEFDDLGHPVFDGDNHYYEALDAFTRHLDPALGPRCVQWCEINGRQVPRARRPGQPRGHQPDVQPDRQARRHVRLLPGQPRRHATRSSSCADREPIRAEYREPDARVARARRAGAGRLLAVPDPRHDLRGAAQGTTPYAVTTTFRAFNRWLLEDWGFNHEDRIFTAPYLTLADPRLGRRGARRGRSTTAPASIVMRPAAPTTDDRPCTRRSTRCSTASGAR